MRNSSAVVAWGEVPCAYSYGGIWCQPMGYELDVPSGKILKRIAPKAFAAKWQKTMAFKFRAPAPPQYE